MVFVGNSGLEGVSRGGVLGQYRASLVFVGRSVRFTGGSHYSVCG